MTPTAEMLFLGTGGSLGVPLIGCSCSVCTSDDEKNKRFRSSVLLTIQNKKILIDCGPDFRTQALKYGITHLDGLILTHTHNDHVAGIDDMRIFSIRNGESMKCLLSEQSAQDMRNRYGFLLRKNEKYGSLPIILELLLLDSTRGSVEFCGLAFKYFSYEQVGMRIDGFRFGDMAYVTDIHHYPETIFEDLCGVKTLVISALRFPASHMHFTVDQAIEFSKKVGAEKTWLIHVSHELDHEKTNAYLPENIRMAYDGLNIKFTLS